MERTISYETTVSVYKAELFFIPKDKTYLDFRSYSF
jgi:hypothetical protein